MKKWRGVKPCSMLIHQLRPFRLVYNISMALCTPYMMHLLAGYCLIKSKRCAICAPLLWLLVYVGTSLCLLTGLANNLLAINDEYTIAVCIIQLAAREVINIAFAFTLCLDVFDIHGGVNNRSSLVKVVV